MELNLKYGWNIDHKKPISQGGNSNDSNIRAMHWKNNIAKGDKFVCNNYDIVYTRALVYKPNIEDNDSSNTGMRFTDNEARDH